MRLLCCAGFTARGRTWPAHLCATAPLFRFIPSHYGYADSTASRFEPISTPECSCCFSFAFFASFADQKLYAPPVGFMVRVQFQPPEQAARNDSLQIGRAHV